MTCSRAAVDDDPSFVDSLGNACDKSSLCSDERVASACAISCLSTSCSEQIVLRQRLRTQIALNNLCAAGGVLSELRRGCSERPGSCWCGLLV